MSAETAILDTLEEYADAYCAKDLPRLMNVFADGEAISLIGTGGDELCSGRDAVSEVFARNFRDATATRFEWGWTDVIESGDAAVVAVALRIYLILDDAPLTVPIRWTVSLIKTDAGWKWLHRHASAAADSQDDGAAYPTGD